MRAKSNAFTAVATGIAHDLRTHCGFCAAFDPASTPEDQRPDSLAFEALWDTGATHSVISQRIVDDCGLKPIGIIRTRGVGGEHLTEQYLVNIALPNQLLVYNIPVSRGILEGFDALIGMDIITQGDLSVTNVGGKTTFSFRYPSLETVDYVRQTSRSPWGPGPPGGGKKKGWR